MDARPFNLPDVLGSVDRLLVVPARRAELPTARAGIHGYPSGDGPLAGAVACGRP